MKRIRFLANLIMSAAVILSLTLALTACGKGSLTSSDLKGTTAAVQETTVAETTGKAAETTADKTKQETTVKATETSGDKDKQETTKQAETSQTVEGQTSENGSQNKQEASQTAESKADTNQDSTQNKEPDQSQEQPVSQETTAETTPETTSVYITVDGGAAGCFYSGEIVYEGSASVFDILCMTGVAISGSSSYVSAINGLAEKEHGPMSGWMYLVNGNMPMISCGGYFINPGDEIYWYYQYDE